MTECMLPHLKRLLTCLGPRVQCCIFFFFLMIRRPPRSPLFPSTPPFRSPQRPCEHQPFLASSRMHDGKNHLHVVPLLRAMKRRHALGDPHLAAFHRAEQRNDVEMIFSVDRKSTRLNSSHLVISYAVFCLK